MKKRLAYLHHWLYYRCYRYSRKGGDSAFTVHWQIAAIQSLLLPVLNLLALGSLLLFISPATAKVLFSSPSWLIGSALVALALCHIFFLAHKGRYKKIIKQFSAETGEEQRRGDRLFGWYLVFSVFSVLGPGIVAVLQSCVAA